MNLEDNAQKIYRILTDAQGVISGKTIGEQLGISRNAVNKHINKLKESGIAIVSERKGYKLVESETFSAVTLSAKLGGLLKVVFKECDSTNNYAKAMQSQIKEDFIVVAPQQSSGRGRLDRTFVSRAGGAYMTMAYKPRGIITPIDALNLVLISGIAVSKILDKYGVISKIKWPNDVLVNGKKICGILLESTLNAEYLDRIFIGIGINMYNDIEEIADIATNFVELGIENVDREEVLCALSLELLELINNYCENGFNELRDEYTKRSASIGTEVSIKSNNGIIKGRALGISDKGYLLIENNGTVTEVVAGDLIPIV